MRFKKILFTVIAGYLVLTAYFLVWSYRHSLYQAEQASLMRLRGITNAIALQIDGDLHDALMRRHTTKDAITTSGQDSAYAQIHDLLRRNYEANMLKSPTYTLVKDTLEGHYVFGVTSAAQPYFRHAYKEFPESIVEMYQQGGTIPMYSDEFGTWLTAFSVVRNRQGKTVALVLADEPFEQFLATAQRDTLENLLIAMAVMVAIFLTLLRILNPMLVRQKRDQQRLAEAHEQVLKLENFRKEMIANVSHDLRTPIASIQGFAETLSKKKGELSEADRDRYLGIIEIEAKRINKMITELFDLSKLESGQINLNKEPLNLTELAQDTLYAFAEQAKQRSVRLLTEFEQPASLVHADVYWINRVVQNLMSNAIKYVNDEGLIKFTIFKETDVLHFKVCNSGIPIPQDQLPLVFDRYFKAHEHHDGTGLGLAISKQIVALHDGRIWAESDDEITTFRFVLPL